jgi:hypothetical protein
VAGVEWDVTSTGPFANRQPCFYWSGKADVATTILAWRFGSAVDHYNDNKTNPFIAVVVRPGDLAAAPGPGLLVLLGVAIAGRRYAQAEAVIGNA